MLRQYRQLAASILAFQLLVIPAALAQAVAPQGVWTAKKPLPASRNEVALAAVGGKLFVVGGSIDRQRRAADRRIRSGDRFLALARRHAEGPRSSRRRRDRRKNLHRRRLHRLGPSRRRQRRLPVRSGSRRLAHARAAQEPARLGRRRGARRQDPRRRRARRRQHASPSAPTRSTIPRPASGASARRCRSRATTWRWSRSTASFTPSAAASPIRPAGPIGTTSTIPKTDSWSPGRRCRPRAAGSPTRSTRA